MRRRAGFPPQLCYALQRANACDSAGQQQTTAIDKRCTHTLEKWNSVHTNTIRPEDAAEQLKHTRSLTRRCSFPGNNEAQIT